MPIYWSDYFGKTSSFSTEEHGAYLLLIGAYWQRGKALPDDDAFLAQCTKMSRKRWRIVRPKISEHFALVEGSWRHERIEKELLSSCLRITAAHARANARWHPKEMLSTTHTIQRKKEVSKKEIAANAVLPDWLPKESWEGFKEMRRNSRYPLKGRSETLALKELAKLRDEGHDAAAVLDHSTMKGYRGLFPPPAGMNGQAKPRELRYPSDSPMIDTSKITMPER